MNHQRAGPTGRRPPLPFPELNASTAVTALVIWLTLEVALTSALATPTITAFFGLLLGLVVAITLRRSLGRGLVAAAIASVLLAMANGIQTFFLRSTEGAGVTQIVVAAILLLTAAVVSEMVALSLDQRPAEPKLLPDQRADLTNLTSPLVSPEPIHKAKEETAPPEPGLPVGASPTKPAIARSPQTGLASPSQPANSVPDRSDGKGHLDVKGRQGDSVPTPKPGSTDSRPPDAVPEGQGVIVDRWIQAKGEASFALTGREAGLRQIEQMFRSELHRRRLCMALVESEPDAEPKPLGAKLLEAVGEGGRLLAYEPGQLLLAMPGLAATEATARLRDITQSGSGPPTRIAVVHVEANATLEMVLEELESALDIGRATDVTFIDSGLLAT